MAANLCPWTASTRFSEGQAGSQATSEKDGIKAPSPEVSYRRHLLPRQEEFPSRSRLQAPGLVRRQLLQAGSRQGTPIRRRRRARRPPADAITTNYGLWNGCYHHTSSFFHGHYRRRYLLSCIVPEWMNGHEPDTATFRFTATGTRSPIGTLYSSDTDDSSPTFAGQNNLSNLEGSIAVASGNLDIPIDASRFVSHYGEHVSYIYPASYFILLLFAA